MSALVEAIAVTRRFGPLVAVDDVTLEVGAGEVVGLLGANRAGKTTLVRMLLGLLPPTGGEVTWFGRPPAADLRRRLGYVPQGLGLYADLTGRENLAFARAIYRVTSPPPTPSPAPDLPVGQLPLGVQRQLAFAQALDHRPDVLVLDEPTSGVGPLASARLWQAIRGAAETGTGTLVTTHNLDEAVECDRLVVMAAGRVVAHGTAESIVGNRRTVVVEAAQWTSAFEALQAAGLPAALVGRRLRVPSSTVAAVHRALAGAPARLSEVPATLEETFLMLVRDRPTAR